MQLSALQIKSGYSIMNSTVQIQPLVEHAKKLGYTHLALADEGVMHGAITFYQACKNANIQPVIGLSGKVEINQETISMVWLAKNLAGYQHLLRLSTSIQYQEPITMETLQKMEEDIFTIIPLDQWAADIENAVENRLGNYRLPLKQLYLGISENLVPYRSLYDQIELPKVAISDIRFLQKKDQEAFSCLRAIDQGIKWHQDLLEKVEGTYLKSSFELEKAYQDWPELLNNTNSLANSCQLEIPMDRRLLPEFPLGPGRNADDYLEELCREKLEKKYREPTENIMNRFYYELDIIQAMGFSDYFLIVWDFVKYAKENQIMVGPGRGSAAGSLIAYLLDITGVDPVEYDLLFERFLNPDRITLPDIDIDFSDEKRDEVIQYVAEKYGKDRVAQIVTFGTFAARSLLRELFKVLDINDKDAAYILKSIPRDNTKKISQLLKEAKDLTEYVKQSENLKHLFKIANRLEGLPRHISTHAAGVIISDREMTNYVATMPSAEGVPLTQYAMNELADVGLLKMDFLGLRNLTLIEKILKQIHFYSRKPIELKDIPLHDNKTFQLLQKGETNGIFQLESAGMKRVLSDLKPTSFEDVVAVNALYRPGPMEFIPLYIERKNSQAPVPYIHEDLAPILEKTYGVLVYQEQIMQIVHKMAGFTYGEADILRRAVSKKDKISLLANRDKFLNGCRKMGYSEAIGKEIFDWIVRFANYGFNRSHAVAYSIISYQLAYLKANYPKAFFVEVLSMQIGNTDKLQMYMREAKKHHLNIYPPSINHSIGKFRVEKNGIRMGLNMIKGVGYQAVQEILEARKKGNFKHLFDFCLRVSLTKINRKVIESLILAGAFDETHSNRATLLASLDEAMEQGELFKEFDDQLAFFSDDLALDISYEETDSFPAVKQLMMEKEVIGFFISTHPLTEVRPNIEKYGYITIEQAYRLNSQKVKLVAVVQSLKMIRTRKGESMAFAVIGDETGELEAVLFPAVFRQVNHWLKEDDFVYLQGKMEDRNDKKQLIIQYAEPYSFEEKQLTADHIYIRIVNIGEKAVLEKLAEISAKYPGSSAIYLYKESQKQLYKLSSEYNVESSWNVIQSLKELFGENNVVVKHPGE